MRDLADPSPCELGTCHCACHGPVGPVGPMPVVRVEHMPSAD